MVSLSLSHKKIILFGGVIGGVSPPPASSGDGVLI